MQGVLPSPCSPRVEAACWIGGRRECYIQSSFVHDGDFDVWGDVRGFMIFVNDYVFRRQRQQANAAALLL